MKKIITPLIILLSTLFFGQAKAETVTITGDQTYCNNSQPIAALQTVALTGVITEISVQISAGYINGQDLLQLTGTHANVNSVWGAVEGKLKLTGSGTLAEFETALLAVKFSTTNPITENLLYNW